MLRSLVFLVVFYVNTARVPRARQLAAARPAPLGHGGAAAARAGEPVVAEGDLRHALRAARAREAAQGRLPVASKHQSAWDTFALIPVFRDPAMVMKAELGWIPLYGWFSHKFQHIFVSRDRGPERAQEP